MGLKIYIKWWGGENFLFAFQIGHIEIGKVTKFGGIGGHFKGQIGLTLLYNWVAVIKTLKNKENIDT